MARKKTKPPRRKPNTGAVRFKRGRALPWEAAFPIGDGEYRYESFVRAEEAHAHLDGLTEERDHKETPRNVAKGSQTVQLQGVPANVRKALSGHSTAKMDELYTSHAAIEDIRKALG